MPPSAVATATEQASDPAGSAASSASGRAASRPGRRAFVATRYADPERLAAYTAPAYDLIEPAERARLTSADPRSIVHLTLPTFGAEDAAARLAAWRADGTLAVERAAALYVYELAGPGPQPSTRGWVGAVALAPPTVVAPHEATVAAVVADRRALRAATRADLEPVVFAHDGAPGPRPRWPAGSSPNGRPTPTSPTTRACGTGCGAWPTPPRSPPSAPTSPAATR